MVSGIVVGLIAAVIGVHIGRILHKKYGIFSRKTHTKTTNKNRIMTYYFVALVFVGVGLYVGNPAFYLGAVAFVSLAMLRKYWLIKK